MSKFYQFCVRCGAHMSPAHPIRYTFTGGLANGHGWWWDEADGLACSMCGDRTSEPPPVNGKLFLVINKEKGEVANNYYKKWLEEARTLKRVAKEATMTKRKKQIVMDDAKRAEIVDYIVGVRQKEFWWAGDFEAEDPENPKTMKSVSETMRGSFNDPVTKEAIEVWHPFTEKFSCCEGISTEDTDETRFALQDHCKTREHVTNLVNGLSDARQQFEYNFMLGRVFESLSDEWAEK